MGTLTEGDPDPRKAGHEKSVKRDDPQIDPHMRGTELRFSVLDPANAWRGGLRKQPTF